MSHPTYPTYPRAEPPLRRYAVTPFRSAVLCYRLAEYTTASEEAIIMAMSYIARVYKTIHTFPVNIFTMHQLLLCSVMVSAKFFDDSFETNAVYAKLGGGKLSQTTHHTRYTRETPLTSYQSRSPI